MTTTEARPEEPRDEGAKRGRAEGFSKLRARLARPVDIAWLASFRILYGLVMCASMVRFIAYDWIDRLFVAPTMHFTYFGAGWRPELGGPAMHALFWVLAGLGLCVALGLFYRLSIGLFVLGFTYLQLVDVTVYLNHYYLAVLLGGLLALSPAGRAWSVDAWRRGRSVAEVPAAWLYLFRFQIGVVYTFAGLAKLTSDWLLHAQPLSIWLSARTDFPLVGPLFRHAWAAPFMSWAGFLFDTTVIWFLLWRRTRLPAYLVLVGFHVVTRLLFPIGMFPVIMILAALVFFPPAWPRRIWKRRPVVVDTVKPWPVPALLAAGLYAAVQLLLPLRCHLYPGDVLWNEQGMRFSWRVMVREKNGAVSFRVRLPGGRLILVSPREHLTSLQEREMSSQPDLILQLAHHIRDDFDRRGLGPVEVYADTRVSLNGRRSLPMIDGTRDLARVEDGVGVADWILPGPAGPPPRIKAL